MAGNLAVLRDRATEGMAEESGGEGAGAAGLGPVRPSDRGAGRRLDTHDIPMAKCSGS